MPDSAPPVFPLDLPLSDDYVREYADLRAGCPVPHVSLATGGEAYLLLGHGDVRKALTDTRGFSREACLAPEVPVLMTGAKVPGVLANMDGPEHTRLRRLVARALSTGTMARFRPRMTEIADALIDDMTATGAPADLVASFAVPFATGVLCELFGCPAPDVPRLMNWVMTLLAYSGFTEEQTRDAYTGLTGYVTRLVAEKRENPGPDLTSALIRVREEDGDRLSEDELVMLVWSHLGAGGESMADMISNGVLAFHRNPEQWRLLLDRPQLLPGAVTELLRYVGVGLSGFERMATADTELSGVRLPAGSVVIPVWRAANFDEAAFDEPARFDITRTGAPHLGFGHGPHRCSGAPLALAELDVAFGTLLRRLPGLRVACDESELVWDEGMAMRKTVTLPVTW